MEKGRIDHQVKVRGFRIELGEIESVLSQHPGVAKGVATATEMGEGDTRLAAYVVHEPEHHPTVSELRKFLRENLPGYMVPSIIVTVDAFPLSPNGKIARERLPLPSGMQLTGTDYVPPRSDTEKQISTIWKKFLGVDRISLYDNFFDIGGHSLLSMKVLYQIEQEMDLQINPREIIFRNLRQFAQLCEEHQNSGLNFSRKKLFSLVKAALSTN